MLVTAFRMGTPATMVSPLVRPSMTLDCSAIWVFSSSSCFLSSAFMRSSSWVSALPILIADVLPPPLAGEAFISPLPIGGMGGPAGDGLGLAIGGPAGGAAGGGGAAEAAGSGLAWLMRANNACLAAM